MMEVVKQFKMLDLCKDNGLGIELAVRILADYAENLTTGALTMMWLSGYYGMDDGTLTGIIQQALVKVELQCRLLEELYS